MKSFTTIVRLITAAVAIYELFIGEIDMAILYSIWVLIMGVDDIGYKREQ